MSSSERWAAIPDYEGLYEVSDLGRVRRLVLRNGSALMARTPDPLIVADPGIQFGAPTIAGRRVTVRVIVDRFYAGESVLDIAYDYETTTAHVEAALRAGTRRRSEREVLNRLTRVDPKG